MVAKLFKCPFCGRMHLVTEFDFDNGIVECPDNQISHIKKTKGQIPSDILTRRAWNMNRFSLRENNYSGVNVKPKIQELKDLNKHIKNW